MSEILNILNKPVFDERINKIEYHAYQPFASTTLDYNDEIRICIQQMDLYTLPCESYIYIEGEVIHEHTADNIFLTNNFASYIFDEIRYELNGVLIDHCKNVGTTSTIKNFLSLNDNESNAIKYTTWLGSNHTSSYIKNEKFNCILNLKNILGFCEDYNRIIINSKQELVLIRSKNDLNCVISATDVKLKIKLSKVQWWIPHVTLNDVTKLSMLKVLNNNKNLVCSFRAWDIYNYPLLPETTKHTWVIKTTTHLEKPRYVILAFQTDRNNNFTKDITKFDTVKLTNVKLYLNSNVYPYENLNIDYANNRMTTMLYKMFQSFRKSYYGLDDYSFLNYSDFINYYPFIVIDCSHQNESVKTGTVDIRIEFEASDAIPAKTSAYCLILHDKIIEYNPLTNLVHKLI